jgi:hypothetical protein
MIRASDHATEDDWQDAMAEVYADRRGEARREAAEDAFDGIAVTCGNCGERYDPKRHPATRVDQAWVEIDCCPACGSDEVVD